MINLLPGERIDDLERNGYKIIQRSGTFCFGMDAVLLSDFAKAKENEINQLIKKIQNKYDEIDEKYKETAKKYYNVLKKCREDLKLIGDTRSKNNEEFYEGWLIK